MMAALAGLMILGSLSSSPSPQVLETMGAVSHFPLGSSCKGDGKKELSRHLQFKGCLAVVCYKVSEDW